MLRRKEKGQGLVEFALILPLLMLLLLGIVEASRIIWAYITVQTAAREAARFAVSGRPNITANTSFCGSPEGEPGADNPWICGPYSRTVAIKEMAIRRANTLGWSTVCDDPFYEFPLGTTCEKTPGAFGVQVVGQYTTLTSTDVFSGYDHAGKAGLNVKITTYYNLQMIDPIFNALMGFATSGNQRPFIQVRGEISMQNEGVDESLGGVPPPAIGNTGIISGTGSPGVGPNGEIINALNYRVKQGTVLPGSLNNHFNTNFYDIYLSAGSALYKICSNLQTSPLTNSLEPFTCTLPATIPAGFYTLYSALSGSTNSVATDDQQVEIYVGDTPTIQVDNGVNSNIVSINSWAKINLIAHQVPDEPFDIFLVYGATTQEIFPDVAVSSSPLSWRVPASLSNVCLPGGTPCTIQSRRNGTTEVYASGEFYVLQPEIVLAGGSTEYAQGEPIYIYLRGHTPGVQYDLKLSDGGSNTIWLGRTVATNQNGNTTAAVMWTVPETNWPIGSNTGWPNGNFTISSHPSLGSTPRAVNSMTALTQVDQTDITVNTPTGPYLTVDSGYTWPIGSAINIRAHKHPQANNPYYFKFGPWRITIAGSSPVNTFSTGGAESYVVTYRIPLTAAVGVTKTYVISSFINSNDSTYFARRNVVVTPIPLITVLEGSQVLPDTVITIQLTNHAPKFVYQIIYANKLLGEVLTDGSGQATLKYDLRFLPTAPLPDLTNPVNYGIPFDLYSQYTLPGGTTPTVAATTQLALKPANLRITNIQFPANPVMNTTIPIIFTVQNTETVPISRYFDIDLYLDPAPIAPAYKAGQFVLPGDYKQWRNSVAPLATFTLTQPFFLGSYGPHNVFGYADTSNYIFNEPLETDNILSRTLTVTCTPSLVTNNFADSSAISGWTVQLYGKGDTNGVNPTVTGGQLQLTGDGPNTLGTNDNSLVPATGYIMFHPPTPITSSAGLDIRVQVTGDSFSVNGSKAGLELRDNLSSFTSPKVQLAVNRSGSGTYKVQVGWRDGKSVDGFATTVVTSSSSLPIWLRIQRYGGTNTFLFSYVASSSANPTWGAPVYTATIGLSHQLQYGLFMNNTTNGSHKTANFDNLTTSTPGSCLAAQGQPVKDNTPAGLTVCYDPLLEKSFENPPLTYWILNGAQGVFPSFGSAHAGTVKLAAPSFGSNYYRPSFYQQFTMPSWVISATTVLNLELYKNIDGLDGNDANDRFYALITTGPSLTSTRVTTPTLIANGVMAAATYSPLDWQRVVAVLPKAPGINLENYKGQNLYLHLYNPSNNGCAPPYPNPNCHATAFFFDDVVLSPCTTQPLSTTITTRIKGEVVLHRLGGGTQKIEGVKVWAYAEGGTLYETVTIQNGEFNFYNLPATSTGTKYFIYSEYSVVDSRNPTLIETLVDDTAVLLTKFNDNSSPATAKLDLYAVSP